MLRKNSQYEVFLLVIEKYSIPVQITPKYKRYLSFPWKSHEAYYEVTIIRKFKLFKEKQHCSSKLSFNISEMPYLKKEIL